MFPKIQGYGEILKRRERGRRKESREEGWGEGEEG